MDADKVIVLSRHDLGFTSGWSGVVRFREHEFILQVILRKCLFGKFRYDGYVKLGDHLIWHGSVPEKITPSGLIRRAGLKKPGKHYAMP